MHAFLGNIEHIVSVIGLKLSSGSTKFISNKLKFMQTYCLFYRPFAVVTITFFAQTDTQSHVKHKLFPLLSLVNQITLGFAE